MRWTLSAAAALLASAAVAQAPLSPAPGLELPPRYEVEVLIFANRAFDPTEERFDYAPSGFGNGAAAPLQETPVFDDTWLESLRGAPPQTQPPPLQSATPEPLPDPLAEQRAALAAALQVVPLGPGELKLTSEYRRLQAIAAYEPLLHFGWVQPGLPEADSTPFDLKTLGVANPHGTIRVHLGTVRLHITLDLTYQATAAATPSPGAGAGDGLDEIALAPQYRLRATRSARSNELHYFDHPAFGVLVRVTPVPSADGGSGRPAA